MAVPTTTATATAVVVVVVVVVLQATPATHRTTKTTVRVPEAVLKAWAAAGAVPNNCGCCVVKVPWICLTMKKSRTTKTPVPFNTVATVLACPPTAWKICLVPTKKVLRQPPTSPAPPEPPPRPPRPVPPGGLPGRRQLPNRHHHNETVRSALLRPAVLRPPVLLSPVHFGAKVVLRYWATATVCCVLGSTKQAH